MGGSLWAASFLSIFVALVLSPAFAGLKIGCAFDLGLTPQALCFRLLRRLKTNFLCKANPHE